jgi:hypothetical protein
MVAYEIVCIGIVGILQPLRFGKGSKICPRRSGAFATVASHKRDLLRLAHRNGTYKEKETSEVELN